MAVVAQDTFFLADDEREFAVGLEADQAVDHVHTGLFELARPDDVVGLVESRLDLDECEDLLAGLGRVDERLDDRAVARCAVQGLLDREDVRVLRGLLEEGLHARREGLVRVVHEHIGLADRREHVVALVVVTGLERDGGRGQVGFVVQIRAVDLGEAEQPAQIERAGEAIDLPAR